MRHRTPIGSLLVVLALGFAACGSDIVSPTAASPFPQVPVVPINTRPAYTFHDVTLSGIVFEMTAAGPRPIEGALLYCDACNFETHSWTTSDGNGFYQFNGVWQAEPVPMPLSIRKEGYDDPPGRPANTPPNPNGLGWREVTVHGNTRFDIELVRK
jgi:hypothetical protein